MSSSDLDKQFQLEQPANSLEKKLRKARKQLKQTQRQLESAEAAAQAFSEQLDIDRQLQSVNELWQQLRDAQAARAAAEQKQAEQEMQDVHAETMLAEMREQLEADKAEQASAVSRLEEALQSQADAAQEIRTSNFALKAELEELKQTLVAETSQRTSLQRDLQRAQQQATSAADLHEHLTGAQQQLAPVTAERDEVQRQKQAWAEQCEDMHTAAEAKDVQTFTLKNLAAADAVKKAHKERENQAEQATDLSVQLERLQAEMEELRRSSAAEISRLQAELLNYKKIGAVHSAANSKHAVQKSVKSTKAPGKPAINKTSAGKGAVTVSKAAAQGRIGTAQRKQPSAVTQKKTQASSARAGAAPGPGPLPATAGAAVFSDALPADASLPIHGAEDKSITGAGTKRKRATAAVNDDCRRRRL